MWFQQAEHTWRALQLPPVAVRAKDVSISVSLRCWPAHRQVCLVLTQWDSKETVSKAPEGRFTTWNAPLTQEKCVFLALCVCVCVCVCVCTDASVFFIPQWWAQSLTIFSVSYTSGWGTESSHESVIDSVAQHAHFPFPAALPVVRLYYTSNSHPLVAGGVMGRHNGDAAIWCPCKQFKILHKSGEVSYTSICWHYIEHSCQPFATRLLLLFHVFEYFWYISFLVCCVNYLWYVEMTAYTLISTSCMSPFLFIVVTYARCEIVPVLFDSQIKLLYVSDIVIHVIESGLKPTYLIQK